MPTSHAIKSQARELNAAHPDLTYAQARRAAIDLNDRMSFRSFAQAARDKRITLAVRTTVARDLLLPGGRNIEATAGFARDRYTPELAADFDEALNEYRLWLRRFGAIGQIIAGAGRHVATKPDWQAVAYDRQFPTGSDADVLNAYLEESGASNAMREVVADVFWFWIRRDRFNDLDNWYDIVAPYTGDFGGLGTARIWPMRQLPQLIRTSKTVIRRGWVPEPEGIGPAIHFAEGYKPNPEAREAVMVTEGGRLSELYVLDRGPGNQWIHTGYRWEDGDPNDPRPTFMRERFGDFTTEFVGLAGEQTQPADA